MIPDDPICTCGDAAWLLQCFVAGNLIDEALVETTLPNAEQIVNDVRGKHDMLTSIAIAGGQSWEVRIVCPQCRKGMKINSENGPEVLT